MKIIQICAAYKPAYVYGGPTMSVSKLAEELVKAGREVMVLATTANGKEELNVPEGKAQMLDGVKVYYFKRLTKDHTHFSPALLGFLHLTIKQHKRRAASEQLIIHIHAWWNLVSIFSCLVAKWHGVKVILSPRGMLTSYSLNNRNSKFKGAIHFFLGKRLLRYCHIHATSKREQQDVLETGKVKSISVIPNFVRFPVVKQTEVISTAYYRLLFLSRVEEKKGLELLFQALATITIPYQLSIAGSGDEGYIQSLKLLAQQLNIQDQLHWLGHMQSDVKFALLAQNDLLVLTSYNENFANVVVESLAMGTPVLLSEEVGLADYVIENELGWVTPLNTKKIRQGIILSYSETTKRNNIRNDGPKVIKRDFEEQRLAQQYMTLYDHTY